LSKIITNNRQIDRGHLNDVKTVGTKCHGIVHCIVHDIVSHESLSRFSMYTIQWLCTI